MLEHEFHKACSKISVENPIPEDLEFYRDVVKQCLDAGDSLLQFLLNLRDSQGKPPFHNFLASRPESYNAVAPNAMCNLTVGIPKEGADLIHEALQKATDADGRTFCHRNVHLSFDNYF